LPVKKQHAGTAAKEIAMNQALALEVMICTDVIIRADTQVCPYMPSAICTLVIDMVRRLAFGKKNTVIPTILPPIIALQPPGGNPRNTIEHR